MNRYEQYLSTQPKPERLPLGTLLVLTPRGIRYPITKVGADYYIVDNGMRLDLDLRCLCGCRIVMEVVNE